MWQILRHFFERKPALLIAFVPAFAHRCGKWMALAAGNLMPRTALTGLAHSLLRRGNRRAALVAVGLMLSMMSIAFGVSLWPSTPPQMTTLAAPLSSADMAAQLARADDDSAAYVQQAALKPGEPIAALLRRLSVHDTAALRFLNSDARVRALHGLAPGHDIRITVDGEGRLLKLSTRIDRERERDSILTVKRTGNQAYSASIDTITNKINWEMRSGQIGRNFYTAMDRAGVPGPIVAQVVRLFSGQIDFRHGIDTGDRFRIVYERFVNEARTTGYGRVLGVELVTGGRPHQALWYQTGRHAGSYFSFDGKPLQQAFLRSPLKFTRISSGFGMRTHPLLGLRTGHTGVDFAAPMGTRVFAANSGRVSFVGRQNGYGKLVIIDHPGGYSTYYGHMSSFHHGLKVGQRVAQNDPIGRVGSTGISTGPHLHYELRHNDTPINPLQTVVTAVPPLTGERLTAFRRHNDALLARIDLIRSVRVAQVS